MLLSTHYHFPYVRLAGEFLIPLSILYEDIILGNMLLQFVITYPFSTYIPFPPLDEYQSSVDYKHPAMLKTKVNEPNDFCPYLLKACWIPSTFIL